MVDYDELNRRIDASGYKRGALAQRGIVPVMDREEA